MKHENTNNLYFTLLETDIQKASWFKILATKHRGRKNAIPRIDFLTDNSGYILLSKKRKDSLDRKFRKFYSGEIPVVSCSDGIFWPEKNSDMSPIYDDFVKKIIAMRNRWKHLSDEHRDLLEPEQLQLPGM